jgi:hypothetical protein
LATFTRGSALTLPVEDQFISTGTFDSAGRLALFGTASVPGRVIAIDTQTFSHVGSFPLGEGDDYLTHFAFDTARRALFATTGTVPPRVVRFDTAEMLLRGSLPLDWDAPAGPIAVLEDAPRVIVSLSASGARTEPLFGLLSTSSKGASHGISVFLPERSEIEHIDFYSQHAVGSFELRIKDTNRTTKWRSFTRSNTTANGTISIPILEGSKPDLILDPGFYFLEWEVDTTEEIAAYHASALPTCIVEEHYPGAFSNDSTYTSHASSIAITYHALSSSAAAGWEMYE